MDQIIHNLNLKPLKVNADTYFISTIANLNYLNSMGIAALIPTSQQNRKNSGKLPENPFC